MLRLTQLIGFGVTSGAAAGHVLIAGGAAYSLTGAAATLTKLAAPGSFLLAAGAAAYSLTGAAVNFARPLNAGAGSYALTGAAATLTVMAPPVSWDAGSVASVTLSGGNLVATNTGTTSANQGAHVASASGKTSGKYYFEITLTTLTGGVNRGVGVGTTASTYTNIGNSATTGVIAYVTGSVWANGGSAISLGSAWSQGQTIAVAVDLDNRKIWFRLPPSGNWNNSGAADPATNTGGVTIPAGTMVPFAVFGGGSGAANNVFTANFGATTFIGAAPSGFTAGWPT